MTKEYEQLQEIRQALASLSSKAFNATNCENAVTAEVALRVETKIDEIRRMLFDYDERN